ncbi:MAG TPA: hypothetical protein VIK89_09205 [Cytophagaceae bacterium]
MSMNLHNQDYIEAYITDKLSASEKALFEAELSKDPLLQNEVALQKEIVDCLSNYRKAELKNRLNNIDVGLNSNYSSGLRFAASVVIGSLLIGTGIYYFNSKDNSELVKIQAPNTTESIIVEPATENIVKSEPATNVAVTIESSVVSEQAANFDNKKEAKVSLTKTTTPTPVSKPSKINSQPSKSLTNDEDIATLVAKDFGAPNISSPDVKEYFDETEKISERNINIPNGAIAQSTDTKLQNLNISINDKEKKDFHYKYFNNKLFLYGDFNAKPYQLLELNNKHNKQLYLNFEEKYYLLKQNQFEKAPLTEIKDKELIDQLEIINNK